VAACREALLLGITEPPELETGIDDRTVRLHARREPPKRAKDDASTSRQRGLIALARTSMARRSNPAWAFSVVNCCEKIIRRDTPALPMSANKNSEEQITKLHHLGA